MLLTPMPPYLPGWLELGICLKGSYAYHTHFMGEETEAQRR